MTPEELKQLADLLKKFYPWLVGSMEDWESVVTGETAQDYAAILDCAQAIVDYQDGVGVYETSPDISA